MKLRNCAAVIGLLFAVSSLPLSAAFADPPPWAPAHGWRDKHDRDDDWRDHHRHHHHDEDDDDDYRAAAPPPAVVAAPPPAVVAMPYGLDQRVCNRDLIGAALGGATGGLIGSNIGKGKGRAVATVGGVLVGLFVGGKIGRNMDQLDQACAGQVLEHAPDRQTVVWQGQNGGDGYWVTPTRSYAAGNGRYCREYTSDAVIAGRKQQTYGTACRQDDGSWEIVK
ncbi:MAG TPA: glycine zipper 2TM domain-containing protein [Stellaceae bacterium]|nr:glycine zipper 2TM domain-containing protein [Stellaceae bacterium]